MTITPTIAFRNMKALPNLGADVQKEVTGLGRFFDRITGCHVVIEGLRRRVNGGHYKIRIDLSVPGEELVVEHNPASLAGPRKFGAMRKDKHAEPDREHRDALLAIHEAFQIARRQLQDHVRRMRGDMKHHEGRAAGRVTKLASGEDSGFLEVNGEVDGQVEGRGVYFHRNSVLAGKFDRLRIGSEVRFSEETGEKGPQASSMRLVRSRRQGRRAAASVVLLGAQREGAAS